MIFSTCLDDIGNNVVCAQNMWNGVLFMIVLCILHSGQTPFVALSWTNRDTRIVACTKWQFLVH